MMPALTGLRFPLALLVLLFHLAGEPMKSAPGWIASITSFGYIAVNAFFILSGFVLAHSYLDPQGKLRGSRGDFWIARFARIYPVYALAILLSFPHRFEHGQAAMSGWEDLGASLAVFTLSQAWVPAIPLFINSAAWSLSVEAVFYFGFPVLIRLITGKTRRGLIEVIVVCWILLLAPASLLMLVASGGMGSAASAFVSTERWSSFVQYNPLLHVPAFVMGIATQRLFLLERSGRFLNSWRAAAVSFGSLAAIGIILGSGWRIPQPLAQNGVLALGFAALIFCLASGRGALAAFFGHPILVKLGEASYALYLLHLPLWGLTLAVNALTFHLTESSWSFLIADIVITVGVSLAALTFVESPYRKSISAGLKNWRDRRQSPALAVEPPVAVAAASLVE